MAVDGNQGRAATPEEHARDSARVLELIPVGVAQLPGTPDLRFYDPGGMAIIAPLDERYRALLAASADALRLLEWLDAKMEQRTSVLQAVVALERLGYMRNAEPLTLDRIRAMLGSTARVVGSGGST